jgi:hypothetical protein
MRSDQELVNDLLSEWLDNGLLEPQVDNLLAELRKPTARDWTWYTKLRDNSDTETAEAALTAWTEREQLRTVAAGFPAAARAMLAMNSVLMSYQVRLISDPSKADFHFPNNLSKAARAVLLLNPDNLCRLCAPPLHSVIFGRNARLGLKAVVLCVDPDRPENNRLTLVLPNRLKDSTPASFISVAMQPNGFISVHTRWIQLHEDHAIEAFLGLTAVESMLYSFGGGKWHMGTAVQVDATEDDHLIGPGNIGLIRTSIPLIDDYFKEVAAMPKPLSHDH